MVDSSTDSSLTQVKSSYDDVNNALESLLGNVGTGASSADITNLKSTVANLQIQSTSLQNQLNNFVGTNPVGTVLAFTTNTIPNGYLLCNGASFDTTKYSQLSTALNSSTVPDLRGMFLRGLDTTGSVDNFGSTRALLSYEEGTRSVIDNYNASFGWGEDHSGSFTTGLNSLSNLGFDYQADNTQQFLFSYAVSSSGSFTAQTSSGSVVGVSRPKNIAVNYIIKAVP